MTVSGVTYHPREVWQSPSQPVKGPAFDWSKIDTLPLHYTAADDLIDGDPGESADDLPGYLRAIQNHYLTKRGYSVGYNFAVDWLGGVWEIRGFDYKCAANRGWNERAVAVLCLVDGADPLTAEAVKSVRKILAETNRRAGRSLTVRPHSEIGSTACPGDGIRRQIKANEFTPWEASTVQIIDPLVLVDTRNSGAVPPAMPFSVPIPVDDVAGVVVHVENISKDTHADGGHLRIAGTEAGVNDSPGYAHTEADGVNSDTAFVLTPKPEVWVMAVLHAGQSTHVKLTLVGVQRA